MNKETFDLLIKHFMFDQEIDDFIYQLLSERDILSNIETILKLR